MPQIDAPIVAEHRESLLDAAEAILLESGHGADPKLVAQLVRSRAH
jgi:hypothetical protein